MSHISSLSGGLDSLGQYYYRRFSQSDHSSSKTLSDLYKVIYDCDEPVKTVSMRVGDQKVVANIERVLDFEYNPLIFTDIRACHYFIPGPLEKSSFSPTFWKATGAAGTLNYSVTNLTDRPSKSSKSLTRYFRDSLPTYVRAGPGIVWKVTEAAGTLNYSVTNLTDRPSKSLIRHIKDSLPTYLASVLPHREEDKSKQAFIIYREADRIAREILNRKTILPPVIDTSQNPYEYFETPLASYPKLHTASLFKHLIPKMLSSIFSSRNWREEIFIGPMIRLSDLVDSDASLQFIQEYASSNERAFFNSYKCLSVLDAIDLLEKLLPIAQSECLYTDDGSYLWRAADEISDALKALKKYPLRIAPIRPLPQVGQPLSLHNIALHHADRYGYGPELLPEDCSALRPANPDDLTQTHSDLAEKNKQ